MMGTEGMSAPREIAVFRSQVGRRWYQRGGLMLSYIPSILGQCGEMLEKEGEREIEGETEGGRILFE